jgi:hypothetical protein
MADRVERSRKIDGKDLIPLFGGKIFDRRDMLDSGIVHQDIDGAEIALCLANHFADRIGIGHVGGVIGNLYPVPGGQSCADVFNFRGIAKAVEDDIVSRSRKRLSDAESDAAG